MIINIQCNLPANGEIKLSNLTSGVLSVYLHEWGYVCDDNWDMNATVVACRQLGLDKALSFETGVIHDEGTYPFVIDDVRCTGEEQELLGCEYTETHSCSSNGHVRLSCGPYEEFPSITSLKNNTSHTLTSLDNFTGETFVCAAEGVPTPDVYWTINFIDRIANSQLEVTSTNLTNATNVFYCVAESSVGRSVLSVTIHVRIHPVITSPVESYNITLTSLENVSIPIVCLAEGVPSPNVYWTHNFVDRLESSLLEVTSTNLTNATNVFYCVAESSVGRSVFSVTIHVRIHPLITSPSHSYTTTLTSIDGVYIPIECLATGIPTPNVYWTYNNAAIQISSTLRVTGALLTDETNTFRCVAENAYGVDIVTVTYVINISAEELADSLEVLMENLTNVETISDEDAGQTATFIDNSVSLAISNSSNTAENNNAILEAAASTVELIVNKTNGTFSNETTNIVTDVLGTIVSGGLNQTNQTEPETATNEVGSVSTAVSVALRTLETFSSRLNEELLATPGTSSRIVESETITIVVQVVETNESNSLMLPIQSAKPVDYSVTLLIPSMVAKLLSASDNRLAIATSFVKRIDRAPAESGFSQASDILTISVAGRDGKINLEEEVSFEFEITTREGYESVCVSLEGTNWIGDGLRLVNSTNSIAVCNSIHFTSFAVFVTPYQAMGSDLDRTVLSALSYLLLGISFICLLASLVIFCIAGKAFFKVETNIIYFNYCLAMLLAVGLFLFGVESGTFNEIVCKLIAFALHYAWLAVFTWTLCIGILIMFKLVLGVMSNRKIYPYLIVFGWAFPLLIPLITIIIATVFSFEYVDRSQHCFLSHKQHIIWTFISPVIVIILINIVFLTIAISKIIYNKCGKNDNHHRDIVRDALVTGLVLTPVLGIPWIVLILNVVIQNPILEYIFIILNGLMGLVFLLVVVIRNREVQTIFKRRKGIKGSGTNPSQMLSSSVTGSSTMSNKFKKTGTDRKNTLDNALTEEVGIEDAGTTDSCFETFHVYKNPFNTMEKVTTSDVQTLFGGAKGAKRSDHELFEVPPPLYKEINNIHIESVIEKNPIYGLFDEEVTLNPNY